MTTQSPIPNPQSPDLYALVIRLTAEKSGALRATHGHLAHGAFFEILRQVDPGISAALHNISGRKPFTISPLHDFGHGRKGKLPVRAGQEGWLRVTLLDPLLFHTFIDYFLHGTKQPTIQLDHIPFHVSEILGTPGSHPLAGADNLAGLYQRWNEADTNQPTNRPTIPQTIHLHFHTPTAFSRRDPNLPHRHVHVLPDPYFVFGELAGAWDRLTDSETKEAIQQFTIERVVVARHDIRTHMYHFRSSKQVGFTGRVTYEVLGEGEVALVQHLNRLADLAFYTGVGSKTTQGMGQVARIMKYE